MGQSNQLKKTQQAIFLNWCLEFLVFFFREASKRVSHSIKYNLYNVYSIAYIHADLFESRI